VRGTYSLGDYLAESFAEGCHIDRRGLEAVYKRENGFGLTLPSMQPHMPDQAVAADSWMLFCPECSQKMRIIMADTSSQGTDYRGPSLHANGAALTCLAISSMSKTTARS
jgi:hypothetical protein